MLITVDAFKKYLFYIIKHFLLFLARKDMGLFSSVWNKISHKKLLIHSGHTFIKKD